MSSNAITKNITNLLVVAVLVSALLGTIVATFNTMAEDSTNFSATQLIILGVIGTFIVLGIALQLIDMSGIKR